MSEDLLPAPTEVPDTYDWEHVVQDMEAWHPDLQIHAQRLVQEHAAAPIVNQTDVHHEADDASNDKRATPPDETQSVSSEEVSGAFGNGQRTILLLSNDPKFHAACMERNIDPYDDIDKPSYWETFAEYAQARVAALREKNGKSVQLSSFELSSALPAFLFEQQKLSQNSHTTATERRHGKEVVSYFNGLVREFATDFTETSASGLTTSLLNVANIAMEDKELRQSAAQIIRQVVRGAQHESAFGQILMKTGRAFRPANLEEDLKGIDYIVDEASAHPLYIDVKASLSEVEARGSGGAFAVKPDGKVIMYSLVKDTELGAA